MTRSMLSFLSLSLGVEIDKKQKCVLMSIAASLVGSFYLYWLGGTSETVLTKKRETFSASVLGPT